MLGLLEQILKIAESGLTWKKALAGMLFIMLFIGGLFVFEAYTGTWRLARLEKATLILHQLQEIEAGASLSEELQLSYVSTVDQLRRLLVAEEAAAPAPPINLQDSSQPTSLAKFLAGGGVWFFGIIPFLFLVFKKKKGAWPGIIAMAGTGAFFGAINMLIPNLFEPWVNLLVIPGLMFFVVFAVPAISAFNKVRETSQRKSIMNNLRQLASAADQYFLETGETSVSTEKLIGPKAYVRSLDPVAAEVYPEKISRNLPELFAMLPSGEKVSIPF
ncbi:hypothetical protein QEH52_07670 [Coraliomargarita sp. SDUM461003]|uniref:Uncharacterized protein n=1 Tax=Thalassobacterium maritimum TaxID=3041265 RepID=A0ABU1ATH3_9BACT|nr:hypothetical protein [Coraliomargarita sp. SDUM461003]MDQ8207381.1 hypothetical protein [Coraliomargarita sp. SDUM461003]